METPGTLFCYDLTPLSNRKESFYFIDKAFSISIVMFTSKCNWYIISKQIHFTRWTLLNRSMIYNVTNSSPVFILEEYRKCRSSACDSWDMFVYTRLHWISSHISTICQVQYGKLCLNLRTVLHRFNHHHSSTDIINAVSLHDMC